MLYLVMPPVAGGRRLRSADMELLAWVGKPVIVLLNSGPPGAPASRRPSWRAGARTSPSMRPCARCCRSTPSPAAWAGGDALARGRADARRRASGADVAPEGRLAAARPRRLRCRHGRDRRRPVARCRRRRAAAEAGGLGARLRSAGARIGWGSDQNTPVAQAQETLARRLDADARADTQALIRLHGLQGSAEAVILARLASHYQVRLRMDEGQAALWGGVVSGALVGLKADLLSGGLTLGGGLLAGGLLGALGSAACPLRQSRARTGTSCCRGTASARRHRRGGAAALPGGGALRPRPRRLVQGESPPHWKDVVAASLAPHREALAHLWSDRPPPGVDADEPAREGSRQALRLALEPIVRDVARAILGRLYPDAGERPVAAGPAANGTRPIAPADRPQ